MGYTWDKYDEWSPRVTQMGFQAHIKSFAPLPLKPYLPSQSFLSFHSQFLFKPHPTPLSLSNSLVLQFECLFLSFHSQFLFQIPPKHHQLHRNSNKSYFLKFTSIQVLKFASTKICQAPSPFFGDRTNVRPSANERKTFMSRTFSIFR